MKKRKFTFGFILFFLLGSILIPQKTFCCDSQNIDGIQYSYLCSSYCNACESCGCTCDSYNSSSGNSSTNNDSSSNSNSNSDSNSSSGSSSENSTPSYSCSCGNFVSSYGETCFSCKNEKLENEQEIVNNMIDSLTDDMSDFDKIQLQDENQKEAVNDLEETIQTQKDELANFINEEREQCDTSIQEIQKKEENAKSQTTGDPVRITNGEFIQTDVDFYTKSFEINRMYTSFNKTIGSFGIGFSSILDEGLIFGVNTNINEKIILVKNQINNLESTNQKIKSLIQITYKIDNYENAWQVFQEKLANLIKKKSNFEKRIESSEKIKQSLSGTFLYFEAVENYQKVQNGYKNILDLIEKYNSNKIILQKSLNQIEETKKEINALSNELKKLEDDKTQIDKILLENTRRYFQNIETSFLDSGLGNVVLLQGDSSIKRFSSIDISDKTWYLLNDDNTINKNEKIQEVGNFFYYHQINGTIKKYNKAGFLISITDVNGNQTLFSRNDKNKVSEIVTRENQKYKFFYNEAGFISKIQNENYQKEYNYQYEQNRLQKVISPENLSYQYIYDNETELLTKFIKPDGSFTAYFHQEKDKNQNILTTSTQNEEGFRENFDFYQDEKITIYTNHDGEKTFYYFDDNGKTSKIVDSSGNVIEKKYDKKGNLIFENFNGTKTENFYDENQNLIKQQITEIFENGKTRTNTQLFSYDNFGNIVNYTDGDGIFYEYTRDEKGNITHYKINNVSIIWFEYTDFGLISKSTELIDEQSGNYKVTEYQYDENQNLIEEKTENLTKKYEYDVENRVSKVYLNDELEQEIFYTDFTITINQKNGLKTILTKNNRFDLVEKIEIDTVLNQNHTTNYLYDSRHLLVEEKIELSPNVFEKTQFRYSAFGIEEGILQINTNSSQGFYQLSKKTGNNQCITEGVFEIEKIKKQFPELLEKPFYKWTEEEILFLISNSTSKKIREQEFLPEKNAVLVKDSLDRKIEYKYNFQNQLLSMTNFGRDGEKQSISFDYTKAGRLERQINQLDGEILYNYGKFGFPLEVENLYGKEKITYTKSGLIKQKIDGEGFETNYFYNNQGLLESVISYNTSVYYKYNEKNQLISVIYGENSNEANALAFEKYEYSSDVRKVYINSGNVSYLEIHLDAFGNVIFEINGEGDTKKYEYDAKNQLVAEYDGYENVTKYEYNPLGLIEKITYPDKTFEKFSYNESGLVCKKTNPLGQYASYEYDSGNRLVRERNLAQEEKTYEYDDFDRLKNVKISGVITESYEYQENGKKVIFRDGETVNNHGKLIQNRDNYGNVLEETNSLGDKKTFSYDKNGKINSRIDGNANIKSINKTINSNGYEEITTFSNGLIQILTYDKIGRIIKEESLHSKIEYKYNQGNLLILQTDLLTGEATKFSYDKAGRKIKIVNTEQKVEYQYGKNSEILTLNDYQNDVSISFKYDVLGREIEKLYSNGNHEITKYDNGNRIIYRLLEDKRKKVLFAEGYYYDLKGYIRGKVNHEGKINLYDYDNLGRLKVVYSSLDKNLENLQKYEIKENGGKVSDKEDFFAKIKYLNFEEIKNFQSLINSILTGTKNLVMSINYYNIEIYEYDNAGNRIGKETPFGKILYKYDSENRLIGSKLLGAGLDENEYYINYEYDKNGNLLKESSPQKEVIYSYNLENRIEKVLISDLLQQTTTEESYGYDSFGRRVKYQTNDKVIRYQYEGLGFYTLYENSYDVTGYNSGYLSKETIDLQNFDILDSYSTDTTYRYRYIPEIQTATDTKCHYYKDGNLLALNQDTTTAYFSSDIIGSTRYVCDNQGFATNYEYDSFGKPIYHNQYTDTLYKNSNNSENYYNYLSVSGYSGKSYNPETRLNNYGFRDYSPIQGRFITSDPIRDGTNWYTLAVNNPINFVDLWGLELAERTYDYTMNGYTYSIIGNGAEKLTIGDIGCALTEMANIVSTVNEVCISPNILNMDKSNFEKGSDNLLMQAVGEKNGLIFDYWTQEKQGDLSIKIQEINSNENKVFVSAQVYYNEENNTHWVGIEDIKVEEDGNAYVKIAPSSVNDTNKACRRRDSWKLDENGDMWVKTTDIIKIYTFEQNKNK